MTMVPFMPYFICLDMKHKFSKKALLITKKFLRIMLFQDRNSRIGYLLKVSKIIKAFDKVVLENYIFISKSLKRLLPFILNNWFKVSFDSHSHDSKWSNLGYLKISSYCIKTYGRYSRFVNSVYVWNHLQSCHQNFIFRQF